MGHRLSQSLTLLLSPQSLVSLSAERSACGYLGAEGTKGCKDMCRTQQMPSLKFRMVPLQGLLEIKNTHRPRVLQ